MVVKELMIKAEILNGSIKEETNEHDETQQLIYLIFTVLLAIPTIAQLVLATRLFAKARRIKEISRLTKVMTGLANVSSVSLLFFWILECLLNGTVVSKVKITLEILFALP